MSGHTPGPWMISRGAQADAFAIEGASRTVAHVKHAKESDANASLIAAAPDLLAALKETLDACAALMRATESHDDTGSAVREWAQDGEAAGRSGFGVRARAASVKAEGK